VNLVIYELMKFLEKFLGMFVNVCKSAPVQHSVQYQLESE